jgi:hypothetical protein
MFAKPDRQQSRKPQSDCTWNQRSRHQTAKQTHGLAKEVPSPELDHQGRNLVHELSEGRFAHLSQIEGQRAGA